MSEPLWIDEAEVVSVLALPDAVDALRNCLALEASGLARNMPKTLQIWGGHHTLHAIGAVVEGAQIVGTKTWAHTAGGATPLVTLWNSETGQLEAIIEAFKAMKDDLEEEKRVSQKRWAKREKQIGRVVDNTAGMYGDLQGLIGSSMQSIPSLEAAEDEDDAAQVEEHETKEEVTSQ